MFLKSIRIIFFVLCFVSFGQNANAQIITYTFIDPCTKEVTLFSIPTQSGKTTIIFYGKVGNFDANDVSNGTFANWINQSYSDFRKISPCSQQQGQVTQNQITTQIISNTVQSIVSSIMSSSQSQSVNTETSSGSGNSDAGGKGNNDNSNKKKSNGSNNTNGTSTGSSSNQNGGESQSSSGTNNPNGGTNNSQGGGTSTNGGGSTNSGNSTQGGGSTTQPPVGSGSGTSGSSGNNGGSSGSGSTGGSGSGSGSSGNNGGSGSGSGSGSTGGSGSSSSGNSGNNGGSGGSGSTGTSGNGSTTSGNSGNNGGSGTTSGTDTKTQKGEEVGTTVTMNNDAHNDNGSGGGSSKGGKSGGNARSNPIIVSSDITSAQNLNKSYTPIINIGTSRSSMTGLSSYGVTGMVWLNFEQFALSARYTKIHFNKSKKLKFVHNVNLTGVYTYGNFLGFVGYSGILNGGKYGITGFNVSAAATVIATDKSGYYSPSITAFYTRPIKVNKKLIISPEIYIISTPLVYSTKEKVTVSDRYFSGFIGSGFDYQISKRFKVNVNYKANLSTNPQFPILSFFLIGSKVNL
jgi:hypothetical protein